MAARFVMAVVVAGSPLTVTIEGASAVVAAEDFVGNLKTGDRVQAAFLGDRLTVLTRAGGPLGYTGGLGNTLVGRDAAGRTQMATPVGAADVATKGYVDALPITQAGYAQSLGNDADVMTMAVTFPKAFAVGTLPVVQATMHGYKPTTATVSPDDVVAGAQGALRPLQNVGLSRTGFTASLMRDSGTFYTGGKYLIAWTATGTLA